MLAIALAVAGTPAPHVTAESVAAIAVLGIIGTGFAYVLNYQIITSEGATVPSTVTYLLPAVAIVLAGIAPVRAGVALTRRRPKPATDEPQVSSPTVLRTPDVGR
jgi:drug/metabolite transporter (DMT)-like permease